MIDSFVQLFQKGLVLDVPEGATIRDVVTGSLKVEAHYLDGRINTVFLDGQAVDNVDAARVGQGAVLSLSASLPGFVGAALRKGGFYAVMRAEITLDAHSIPVKSHTSRISVRLYNLVAKELGPKLLAGGVRFQKADLTEFLATRPQAFWKACTKITVNGVQVDPKNLQYMLSSFPGYLAYVYVKVPI